MREKKVLRRIERCEKAHTKKYENVIQSEMLKMRENFSLSLQNRVCGVYICT
jgi:hypothetical protein